MNHNEMVPKCLMATYAYYVLDKNIMTDSEYDALCRKLHNNYSSLTHRHKELLGYHPAQTQLMNHTIDWDSAPIIIKEATKQYLMEGECQT